MYRKLEEEAPVPTVVDEEAPEECPCACGAEEGDEDSEVMVDRAKTQLRVDLDING